MGVRVPLPALLFISMGCTTWGAQRRPETNNKDDGDATMEAVYFGNSKSWGKGTGTGPWVMADMENGLFAGKDFGPPHASL